MSRLTRDGTAEPVSRDQNLRHARGQGNVHFPCSADHEQDWQPYPVDPYSAICDDHTYIHTCIVIGDGCSGMGWAGPYDDCSRPDCKIVSTIEDQQIKMMILSVFECLHFL